LAERGFDVVALDHFMPGLSCEATLRAILDRPEAPPVVYVTGSDEGRVAVAALKAGAADYVLKDATDSFFELLGQTLRQAVGVARARRERREAREAIARARDRAELLLRE
ncbi:MAG: response regulator, partial [Sphingomonadaceae bacterium]